MWIYRDFQKYLTQVEGFIQPIKILKGPRQVGKTSLLAQTKKYQLVSFDDFQIRQRAQENPSLFLDQFRGPLILDEATLAPQLFPELKKRVDQLKLNKHLNPKNADEEMDIWITGSNQTLLEKSVQESLAGRATFFNLNTLSIHEIQKFDLHQLMMSGGWPELYSTSNHMHTQYLNDLISTFIEKDIVVASGIERRSAFIQSIGLLAGRIGQLLNYSDIAKVVGVEVTTVQSWIGKLEQNALVRIVRPFSNNLNQRLIKTPKPYFEDVGLAARFQGWTSFQPMYLSSQFGHLVENLALTEIVKFFQNNGLQPEIYFIRSKEKVEVDFIIHILNQQWIACEVKTTPSDFTEQQIELLGSTKLNFIERWILTPNIEKLSFKNSKIIHFTDIFMNLLRLTKNK